MRAPVWGPLLSMMVSWTRKPRDVGSGGSTAGGLFPESLFPHLQREVQKVAAVGKLLLDPCGASPPSDPGGQVDGWLPLLWPSLVPCPCWASDAKHVVLSPSNAD